MKEMPGMTAFGSANRIMNTPKLRSCKASRISPAVISRPRVLAAKLLIAAEILSGSGS